eukprot:401071-Prymnesium_polylepis.2
MLNTGLACVFGTLAGTVVDAIGFRDWVFIGAWLVAATPFVSAVGFSPWAMGRFVHVRACARLCMRASHACAAALSNTCGCRLVRVDCGWCCVQHSVRALHIVALLTITCGLLLLLAQLHRPMANALESGPSPANGEQKA